MGDSTRYRFREYSVHMEADPLALPTFRAVCVTGEEANCGASSEDVHSDGELLRWISRHCARTGHKQYERTTCATVRAEPGAWK